MELRYSINVWLMAARLQTLPAGACPVIIGTVIALKKGLFHPLSFLLALSASLGIQICSNFVNDYCDFIKGADTESRKGPKRVMQAGLLTKKAMKQGITISFFIATILSIGLIFRGGMPIVMILLASLLAAYFYTGGTNPLGYMGLGELLVFIFFGPIAVMGTYYLHTLSVSIDVFFLSLSPGLLSTAILAINNLRDKETDALAFKITLCVRFGVLFGKIEYLACIVLTSIIPLILAILTKSHYFSMMALLILPFSLPLIIKVFQHPTSQELNIILVKTAKLLVFYTFLFSLGYLL